MKNNQQYYSEKLRLKYEIKKDWNNKRLVKFEDGVEYKEDEFMKLKGLSNIMMINIHNIKNIFKGQIL